MFEILISIFIIYLFIILFPLFLGCFAIFVITCVAAWTWIKEKLTQ